MSAQTGSQKIADLPPESRRIDRARIQLRRWQQDPNPVWMRELRQSARLQSTPIILAVLTALMTLLIASIGGLASVTGEPASVGVALFHTFFSLAFFVVAWTAPAVAANTIATEKGGRTWEALLLTGLGPSSIARGKFQASLTYIGLYITMLAPVAAISFLFGGVTPLEVLTALFWLLLIAALSVAFGLSLSSAFNSPAVAIVVTLLIGVPLSLLLYTTLGPTLSIAVHELWPGVPAGPPIWLPTAYVRADFGLEYLAFLVIAPTLAVLLPAWFFYEVTVANMTSPSDDRSSGLRRWLLLGTPAVAIASFVPALTALAMGWVGATLAVRILFGHLIFACFVVAGEPLGPSRRVRVHWDRNGVGWLKRYMGPGILRASTLVLVVGTCCLLSQEALGVGVVLANSLPDPAVQIGTIVVYTGYLSAFFVFMVGLTAWVRARSRSATVPRLLLGAALFLTWLGPWIIMAIAGLVTDGSDAAYAFAAPSPAYLALMIEWLDRVGPERELLLGAGAACALAYALLGLGLLGLATHRTRRVVAEHDRTLERVEAMLAQEELAAQGGS